MSQKTLSLRAGRPSETNSKVTTLASLSDKSSTVRVNFELDRDYHTKLKIFAAEQGRTIKELLSEYVIEIMSK